MASNSRLTGFINYVRRRRIGRVVIVYALTAWAVIQVASTTFPYLNLPAESVTALIVLAVLGFPVAVLVAWIAGGRPAAATPPIPAAAVEQPNEDRSRSIVVLPFANISADPDNEYFSDGLTEEIITDLTQIRELHVISRTSAMRLKGSSQDTRAIAQQLSVGYVLEGAVRKAGEQVRITAKLVDARRDQQLWAEVYNGTVQDIFDIQERVAHAIVAALRLHLSAQQSQALSIHPITDARAHECYLRARHEIWSFSQEGLERAHRYITQALELVGDNELLYATLAHIYVQYRESGIDIDNAYLTRAEECAQKMLALNPGSPRAYWVKGFVSFQRGDVPEAIRFLLRARAGEPDSPETLMTLGYMYALLGQNAAAAAVFARVLQVDPLTPVNHCMPGFLAALEGRYADALPPYRRFYEMEPDSPFGHATYAWALALNRDAKGCAAIVADMRQRFPNTVFTSLATALSNALDGDSTQALAAITPELEAAGRGTEMFSRMLCECYALAGAIEPALVYLERDIELGMRNYPFLAKHDWFLHGLRGDPRFADLLERVRLDWESVNPAPPGIAVAP